MLHNIFKIHRYGWAVWWKEKAGKGPWDGRKGSFFGQSRQKDDSVKLNVASSDLRLKVSKIRDQG
nr:hypothetical protein [Desulfuromonas soudanensis]